MNITKQQKNAAKFASIGNALQPALAGVLFDGVTAVATDSFSLVEVTNNAPDTTPSNPIILEARGLSTCKMNRTLIAEIKEENGSLFFVSDVETKKIETRAHADQYPKYQPILTEAMSRKDDIKIRVDAKFLANIVSFLATFDPKFGSIDIGIPQTAFLPIVFEAHGDNQTARALLMHMRQ